MATEKGKVATNMSGQFTPAEQEEIVAWLLALRDHAVAKAQAEQEALKDFEAVPSYVERFKDGREPFSLQPEG